MVLAACCSTLSSVLICSALVCSTCVWHYCDKAAQPLLGDWGMSETRAEKRTASQHLMEWETHSLHGWPTDATAWEQNRGWRPSKTPNVCVKYHSFFPFSHSLPYMHTSPLWFPSRTFSAHTLNICSLLVSHNTVLYPLDLSGAFSTVSIYAEQTPITLWQSM